MTIQMLAIKNCTSTSMPTEIKKKLVKMSRNGRIMLTAWWLYSDSEMSNPASSAPIARDIPIMETSQATPKQTRITNIRNSSWLRDLAISLRSQGMIHFALKIITTIRTTSWTTRRKSDSVDNNGVGSNIDRLARKGIAIIMGIAMRSWKIRIPRTMLPCGESISSLW